MTDETFHWPHSVFLGKRRVLEFYKQAAQAAAEIIYLGEVICSKRACSRTEDWIAIGNELQQDGKEVILSSLTLLEAASEMSSPETALSKHEFMVEANDISAVQLLSMQEKVCHGPSVNIYNHRSLKLLAAKGLKRWVLPVELGLDTLKDLQEQRPEGWKRKCLRWAACHWLIRRAATPPGPTTCPRMIASSNASTTLMEACLKPGGPGVPGPQWHSDPISTDAPGTGSLA